MAGLVRQHAECPIVVAPWTGGEHGGDTPAPRHVWQRLSRREPSWRPVRRREPGRSDDPRRLSCRSFDRPGRYQEHDNHTIFVEELYTNRWLLRDDTPGCRLGFFPDFLAGNPDYSDVGSEPTDDVQAILTAWVAIHARTLEYVARATPEELRRGASYDAARQGTAGK